MSGQELIELGDKLLRMHENFHEKFVQTLGTVTEAANSLHKSWSGSNLGYQAEVYYHDLKPRPPGAQFSSEWGIGQRSGFGSKGAWREYAHDDIIAEIYRRAGDPKLNDLREASKALASQVEPLKAEVDSVLAVVTSETGDSFLKGLREKRHACRIRVLDEIIALMVPSGQTISRDMIAITQGLNRPGFAGGSNS